MHICACTFSTTDHTDEKVFTSAWCRVTMFQIWWRLVYKSRNNLVHRCGTPDIADQTRVYLCDFIFCALRTTIRGLEETSRTATQFLGPDCTNDLANSETPILGFRKQERQLRTGSTGGCLRSIAQRTRSGACSYWIGIQCIALDRQIYVHVICLNVFCLCMF